MIVYLIDFLCIGDWWFFVVLFEVLNVIKVLYLCSEDLEVFLCLIGSLLVLLFDM